MKNYKHAIYVMEKQDYPVEGKQAIIRAEEKIVNNPQANKIYESMYYAYWKKKKNFNEFKDKVNTLAELIDEHIYTVNFVLIINCTRPLLAEYKNQGISEDVYWNTLLDLKSKFLESKENYDVWGTFVPGWFMGFFTLTRFGLGRFQYEFSGFNTEYYNEHGVEIKEDEFVLGMHIPSHQGTLSVDIREASYKKAYEFFRDKFPNKPMIVCCHSWLLYPDNLNILPQGSKTSEFLLDYEPLDITRTYDFGDLWRVFGCQNIGKPYAELPEDTSMRRAFKNWLVQGKKTGNSSGILIFDGEKVRTRNTREEYKEKFGY